VICSDSFRAHHAHGALSATLFLQFGISPFLHPLQTYDYPVCHCIRSEPAAVSGPEPSESLTAETLAQSNVLNSLKQFNGD
jgi:hypothetical protein